jgi:hypothetical protein
MIETFGLQVVGFEIVVRNGPGGRDSAEVADFTEVFPSQTKQSRAVKLCVSADVVIGVWVKGLAVLVAPFFLGLVFPFDVDGARVPVVPFATHVVAAFDEENILSARSECVRECSSSRPCADDDDVIVLGLGH